ncbi:MAG: M48 family metalloprotease [Clostridiales bacterium]|nr:M48 family metalloprotease [Clostridiales bacterium]
MDNISNAVEDIKKSYAVKGTTDIGIINRILGNEGCRISTYKKAHKLIKAHNLQSFTEKYRAFTYNYNDQKIVLHRDELKDEQLIFALAHEIGHIALGHNEYNKKTEAEADEFARLLVGLKPKQSFNKRIVFRIDIIISIIATITILISVIMDMRNVYVTASGARYHRKDCYHLTNRSYHSITIEDATENGYTPCKTCRPGTIFFDFVLSNYVERHIVLTEIPLLYK